MERFIVVWFPVKSKDICTIRGAVITVIVMAVINLLLHLYYIWGFELTPEGQCDVHTDWSYFMVRGYFTMTSYERHGISNHRQIKSLVNSLFKPTRKKNNQKYELVALCEGNQLMTVDSSHKGSVMWKAFTLHDVIGKSQHSP